MMSLENKSSMHRSLLKMALTAAGVLAAPLYIHLIMSGAAENAAETGKEVAVKEQSAIIKQ